MPTVYGVDEAGNRVQVPYTVLPASPASSVALFSNPFYAGGVPKRSYVAVALQSVKGQAAAILKAWPNTLSFIYQDGIWANPTASQGVPQDPAWTAKDASGNPIQYGTLVGQYLAQPDSQLFQQAWLAHAIAQAEAFDGVGVFIDDVSGQYPGKVRCPQYPSKAAWQTAMISLVQSQVAGLHAAGLMVWVNIGGATAQHVTTPDPFWMACAGLADWATEESWMSAGAAAGGLVQQAPYFTSKLANVAWSEAHGKGVMLRCGDATEAGNTFGLAAMLLVATGHTTYSTANTAYNGQENWFPEYTTAQQLGAPLGPYTVAGSVYTRLFQGGWVTVDTNALTGQIVLG